MDRLLRRTVGLRRNAQRPMISALVHKYRTLVIEDLNVRGMMTGLTPKAQADAGNKGRWHHCEIVLADRYHPSSKTCSACGVVNAKLKRERRWRCESCGTDHSKNLNAAVNLRNLLTFPSVRGATLRDGKALAIAASCRETGPDDRRKAPPEIVSATLTMCWQPGQNLNVNTP